MKIYFSDTVQCLTWHLNGVELKWMVIKLITL
jgi:hypothetical protein